VLEQIHGRTRELLAIDRLLAQLEERPAVLVFEGEPGIGKTTLMRAAVTDARKGQRTVLACSGAVTETRLSYVALSDLFSSVDPDAVATSLPPPQREALDAALLRAGSSSADADPGAVASAVLALLEKLAETQPVLVAVDDVQWLDRPSAGVIEFCARRLSGTMGMLVSRRPRLDPNSPPRFEGLKDLVVEHVSPLSDRALTTVVREQAGGVVSRRAEARIVDLAGGNPLYALELLRALPPGEPPAGPLALPPNLQEMVATRLAGLGPEVEELLLAVAALADPTVDLLARALGPEVPALVEQAEAQGVLERWEPRVRFTHPLLAEGTLARAPASKRRAMHRRLSGVVSGGEDRARHLALGEVLPEALTALVEAADETRARGAPMAAAELLELALELGGDSSLRVRAAAHHLDAGQVPRAEELLEAATADLAEGEERAAALLLLADLRMRADSFVEAQALLEQAAAEGTRESPLQVEIGLRLAFAQYNLNQRVEAAATGHGTYELAERLEVPGLLAQALGVLLNVDFAIGRGIDEERLVRALELEDPALRTWSPFRPSLTVSMVLAFSGRIDEALELLEGLTREQMVRGEEHDLAWVLARVVWLQCWRGDLEGAEWMVNEAEQRLLALDTPVARLLALTARGQVEAYAGRADKAREVAEGALALAEETQWRGAIAWQHMTLGFLELSVGDHEAATARLASFAESAIASGLPEPAADGALVYGDAAEALILVGRVEEAEPLVALLEERGAALDRTWAIAVGARCRALVLAAEGDVRGAEKALQRALAAHRRLPMPVEHGRTLLALGRMQRRMRERSEAKRSLDQALGLFEKVGAQLWAEQACSELAALGLRAGSRDELTASEERVARLAATGLTNRQIASSLQVSPKTVESQLGRVYRKLEVRSRAELGARIAAGELDG
jgi:DNA-binding CsgD family transcriptional regulator